MRAFHRRETLARATGSAATSGFRARPAKRRRRARRSSAARAAGDGGAARRSRAKRICPMAGWRVRPRRQRKRRRSRATRGSKGARARSRRSSASTAFAPPPSAPATGRTGAAPTRFANALPMDCPDSQGKRARTRATVEARSSAIGRSSAAAFARSSATRPRPRGSPRSCARAPRRRAQRSTTATSLYQASAPPRAPPTRTSVERASCARSSRRSWCAVCSRAFPSADATTIAPRDHGVGSPRVSVRRARIHRRCSKTARRAPKTCRRAFVAEAGACV